MPQESPAESSATKRGSVAQRSVIEDQAAIMALASKMHFEKKRRRHPLRRPDGRVTVRRPPRASSDGAG